MINFNIPPFTGKETEYMAKAIQNHKISGDGEFTKKCNKWIEDHTGTAKALLTTSCTLGLPFSVMRVISSVTFRLYKRTSNC